MLASTTSKCLALMAFLLLLTVCYFGAEQYVLFCPVENSGGSSKAQEPPATRSQNVSCQLPVSSEPELQPIPAEPRIQPTTKSQLNSSSSSSSSSPTKRCPVFTYFQPLGQWSHSRNDQELLRLWQRNWYSLGKPFLR